MSLAHCLISWSKSYSLSIHSWTWLTYLFFVLSKLIHCCYGLLSFTPPPPLTFWRLMWLALPPLLSINQFKSNKCGIFSRTVCIPLVWLWKVVFVMRCVCAFVFSLIAFCLLQPEAAPSTLWPFLTLWFPSSFHCSSSPSFQRFIPVMTHHNFWFGNVIVGKRNKDIEGPLSELLAFMCGIIKMLHKKPWVPLVLDGSLVGVMFQHFQSFYLTCIEVPLQ